MLDTLRILIPEITLAVIACVLLLGGTIPAPRQRWGQIALAALALAGVILVISPGVGGPGGITIADPGAAPIVADGLSAWFRAFSLVVGILLTLGSLTAQQDSETAPEFYSFLLLMTAGMMVVSTANELMALFLALELVTVPAYILLYVGRRDTLSQESAVKYFFLSIMSAAMLLYGFAILYGIAGSSNLSVIRTVLADLMIQPNSDRVRILGLVSLLFVFAGLGFKMAAVPFHFYAPDVYDGTSTFNASLMAVVPKAIGLVAIIRVVSESMPGMEVPAQIVALIMAALSMTLGNCLAVMQTNVRRLLAYSGIAHSGYMLLGIAAGLWERSSGANSAPLAGGFPGGSQAALLYLSTYTLSSLGLFAVLMYLPRQDKQIDQIDDLAGLGKTHPIPAIIATFCLLSMAGIPLFPGFWGKFSIFMDAVGVVQVGQDGVLSTQLGFAAVAILGMLNAAVGAAYYLRLISVMFLHDPISIPQPAGGRGAYTSAVLAGVAVAVLGLIPSPLFTAISQIQLPSTQRTIVLPNQAAVADTGKNGDPQVNANAAAVVNPAIAPPRDVASRVTE